MKEILIYYIEIIYNKPLTKLSCTLQCCLDHKHISNVDLILNFQNIFLNRFLMILNTILQNPYNNFVPK